MKAMPSVKQQQKHAREPVQFARILVGPVQKDLRHVHHDHDDHGRPGPVVQRTQEPAERLLIVEIHQALIGLVGGRHVDHRQTDSGQDLEHQQRHRARCRRRTTSPSVRRRRAESDASASAPRCSRRARGGLRTRSSTSLHRGPSRLRRLDPACSATWANAGAWTSRLPVLDPPDAVEQAARRRSGGALAVLVIDAAVARAHEQTRLRKPGHRAAQVGAVHGEDQELILPLVVLAQVADINAHLSRHAVPRLAQRILERRQPGLVDWELARRSQADPVDPVLPQGPEQIADERDAPRSRRPPRQLRRSATGERAPSRVAARREEVSARWLDMAHFPFARPDRLVSSRPGEPRRPRRPRRSAAGNLGRPVGSA